MKSTEIINYLKSHGVSPNDKVDRKLWLSGHLIRGVWDGIPIIAVGSERNFERKLNALVDGIYWCERSFENPKTLRIIYGGYENSSKLLDSLATLIDCYQGEIKIEVEIDFKPCILELPDFSELGSKWLSLFQGRKLVNPPDNVLTLSKLVQDESFRWYRSVTGQAWSGRVEGLEVCRAAQQAEYITVDVGKPGKKGDIGKARQIFLDVVKKLNSNPGQFDSSRLKEAAAIIKAIADIRKNGELKNTIQEHHLESRVLREALPVYVNGQLLKPVIEDYPFQLPTLWSPNGKARFLDALMRHENVPWAVELKVITGSAGEYYRHAITQAVLYREFIKKAKQMHIWFIDHGLDAENCQGLVAFPKLVDRQKYLLKEHQTIGELFGVKVIELES